MKNDNKEIGIYLSVKEWRRLWHILNYFAEDYMDFDSPMYLELNNFMEIIAKAIYDYE